MKWQDITPTQRKAAARLREKYENSISQIVRYFDEYMAHERGEITTARLEEVTGRVVPAEHRR